MSGPVFGFGKLPCRQKLLLSGRDGYRVNCGCLHAKASPRKANVRVDRGRTGR